MQSSVHAIEESHAKSVAHREVDHAYGRLSAHRGDHELRDRDPHAAVGVGLGRGQRRARGRHAERELDAGLGHVFGRDLQRRFRSRHEHEGRVEQVLQHELQALVVAFEGVGHVLLDLDAQAAAVLLGAGFCMVAAHGVLYVFFTLHLQHHGRFTVQTG